MGWRLLAYRSSLNPGRYTMETEERESRDFLATLGLAFFYAQAVEYGLVSVFAATELERGGLTKSVLSRIRPIMDARYKQVLGKLVRDAAGDLNLAPELTSALESALQQRNWLVHHFYAEFAPAAFHSDIREMAIRKLRPMIEEMQELNDKLAVEAKRRMATAGIPDKEMEIGIQQAMDDYVSDLRK